MSKKSGRIAAMIADLEGQGWDPHYLGYFRCFNEGLYYEAHDVLEELWLGCRKGPDHHFYKGLIQLAGAFVHLQKDRLGPAAALFRLAQTNLGQYPPVHEGLDVGAVLGLIQGWLGALEEAPGQNPLAMRVAPRLWPDAVAEPGRG